LIILPQILPNCPKSVANSPYFASSLAHKSFSLDYFINDSAFYADILTILITLLGAIKMQE